MHALEAKPNASRGKRGVNGGGSNLNHQELDRRF